MQISGAQRSYWHASSPYAIRTALIASARPRSIHRRKRLLLAEEGGGGAVETEAEVEVEVEEPKHLVEGEGRPGEQGRTIGRAGATGSVLRTSSSTQVG